MASGSLPRRGVLLGGLAAVVTAAGLAGCTDTEKPPPPSPVLPVLAGSRELVAAYDAVLVRHADLADRLAALRADHRRHVQELTKRLGSATPSASASATPSTPVVPDGADAAVAMLLAAERRAQQDGTTACLSAPAEYATLFGSVAACRASHVAVLS
ncbi:hypothetical protein [Actinocatenispora rupis]|uniref:Uncharacterized protein n=1 Tax=Actinocatenispora rupis TaxID=519421 RepID=A0A8J3ISM9_9ACTN|nr:hypothetical protein [Actinocatenispora rupis]GID09176.1 hypothetical protein Aru02nite_00650 [Actinocatenispora rupis]